ncbi:uncharacterized protein WCC33_015198 [Rhinophrynus dorsalis]
MREMKGQGLMAIVFLLLLSCQIGHALECYKCEYGTCLLPAKTTCGLLEICVTETAKVGYVNLKKRGCTSPANCLTDSTVTYAGIAVTTSPSCCLTDLCNSAAKSRVSVFTCLSALMAFVLAKLF